MDRLAFLPPRIANAPVHGDVTFPSRAVPQSSFISKSKLFRALPNCYPLICTIPRMNKPLKDAVRPRSGTSLGAAWVILWLIFAAVQFAALFQPPLLDDVDATHAEAAQHMAETGDVVTLYVNGVRYLEKPPLPYWLTAADYRIFGQNVFATHLPNALAILGCAWICWLWAGRTWGRRTGYYAALAMLTAVGPFLFTRFAIPEALLSFLIMLALWNFLAGLEDRRATRIYAMWAALALATLAKGLVAPVFFIAAAVPFLIVSGLWRRWRELKPVTGILLFLAVAAPWHILAGLANPDQGHPLGNHPTLGNVHGFWYFYFINEHVLRFLGGRYPNDYNKMPFAVYWLAHLVWLFPWSIFVPAVLVAAWKTRRVWLRRLRNNGGQLFDSSGKPADGAEAASYIQKAMFRARSAWLLGIYSAFVLVFFSLSTNQEYYTFPRGRRCSSSSRRSWQKRRRGAIPWSFVSGTVKGSTRVNFSGSLLTPQAKASHWSRCSG